MFVKRLMLFSLLAQIFVAVYELTENQTKRNQTLFLEQLMDRKKLLVKVLKLDKVFQFVFYDCVIQFCHTDKTKAQLLVEPYLSPWFIINRYVYPYLSPWLIINKGVLPYPSPWLIINRSVLPFLSSRFIRNRSVLPYLSPRFITNRSVLPYPSPQLITNRSVLLIQLLKLLFDNNILIKFIRF